MTERQYIGVGKITGAFGVKGRVKVFSYTDPKENIIKYSPWKLTREDEVREVEVIGGKLQGKAIVAQIKNVANRDEAEKLSGWDISVSYSQLPATEVDEYYWQDLIGLKVETVEGVVLGKIDYLLETGANDVVVVKGERERLIPFLQGDTIINIDLEAGIMTVNWDPEF